MAATPSCVLSFDRDVVCCINTLLLLVCGKKAYERAETLLEGVLQGLKDPSVNMTEERLREAFSFAIGKVVKDLDGEMGPSQPDEPSHLQHKRLTRDLYLAVGKRHAELWAIGEMWGLLEEYCVDMMNGRQTGRQTAIPTHTHREGGREGGKRVAFSECIGRRFVWQFAFLPAVFVSQPIMPQQQP